MPADTTSPETLPGRGGPEYRRRSDGALNVEQILRGLCGASPEVPAAEARQLAEKIRSNGLSAEVGPPKKSCSPDEEEGALSVSLSTFDTSVDVEPLHSDSSATAVPGSDAQCVAADAADSVNSFSPPFYICLYFEATSWSPGTNPRPKAEIIEFPAIMLDRTGKEVGEFHEYVHPTEAQGKLSQFCVGLTEITENQVKLAPSEAWPVENEGEKRLPGDVSAPSTAPGSEEEGSKPPGAKPLDAVIADFSSWVQSKASLSNVRLVTCSTQDQEHLFEECERKGISFPKWMERGSSWLSANEHLTILNGGKHIDDAGVQKTKVLSKIVEGTGGAMQGRLHSGRNDTRNLAGGVKRMLARGCTFQARVD